MNKSRKKDSFVPLKTLHSSHGPTLQVGVAPPPPYRSHLIPVYLNAAHSGTGRQRERERPRHATTHGRAAIVEATIDGEKSMRGRREWKKCTEQSATFTDCATFLMQGTGNFMICDSPNLITGNVYTLFMSLPSPTFSLSLRKIFI